MGLDTQDLGQVGLRMGLTPTISTQGTQRGTCCYRQCNKQRSVTLLCAPQPCSLCGYHLHSAPSATIRPRANSRPGSPERAA